MSLIKNPTLYAWAGITFGFLTYHFSVAGELVSTCDINMWLLIPMVFLFIFPFIYRIAKHKLVITFLGLVGSVCLFFPHPWSLGLGITSVTLMFLPAIITHIKPAPMGIVIALISTYLLHLFEVIPQVNYGIFILLVLIFLFFYFRNTFPVISWKNSLKIQNTQHFTLFLLWIFGISYVILLAIWICFFTSHNTFPGIIAGIIVCGIIHHFFHGFQKKWSPTGIWGTIFILFFVSMILQGYLSRSFGVGFIILSSLLFSLISVTLLLSIDEIQKRFHLLKKDFITEKKLFLFPAGFVILCLCIHLPFCYVWLDKIEFISLPENVIDLSLSQYMLKNLTILPAISTLLSGIIFLNRKKWIFEKFKVPPRK